MYYLSMLCVYILYISVYVVNVCICVVYMLKVLEELYIMLQDDIIVNEGFCSKLGVYNR